MAKELTKQDDMDIGFDMSDMMMIMMMIIMASLLSATASTAVTSAQTAQALQAMSYEGIADPRTVYVDERFIWLDLIRDHPYRPWVHAYFINDGPFPVQVGINQPSEGGVLDMGETWTVDRSGATRKVEALFFVCPIGGKATLRVTGEY